MSWLHIYYRLLRLMHIEAELSTVVCGLRMAVVDVDSPICIAGVEHIFIFCFVDASQQLPF